MAAENPVLYLQAIERNYRQGQNVLNILRGAELAVGPMTTRTVLSIERREIDHLIGRDRPVGRPGPAR